MGESVLAPLCQQEQKLHLHSETNASHPRSFSIAIHFSRETPFHTLPFPPYSRSTNDIESTDHLDLPNKHGELGPFHVHAREQLSLGICVKLLSAVDVSIQEK